MKTGQGVKTALESRIDEVLEERKTFPNATAWCLAAGVSKNYLSALRSRLRNGQVVQGKANEMESLARAAGVSVEWLMGRSSNPTGEDPLFKDLVFEIQMRPGLSDALIAGAARYHTLTVVKALQVVPSTKAGGGVPSIGWTQLLDDIERGRNEPTTGNATEVGRAAQKQVGRRPKLP